MIDRNRLIEAWKIFRDSNPYEICDRREFRAIKEPEYCMGQMIEDTIALLDDCDTQLQYRDDHIALYEAEINRLEALLKEQEHKDRMFHALEDDWKRIQELMKEDDAKCLTKEELDELAENQFVWIEERTGYLYCLQIIGICRGRTGVSDIQFNAPTAYVEKSTNTYRKSYRIWTGKPKDEQRHAVNWE